MHSIISIIGYIILLPLALGIVASVLLGRDKILSKRRFATKVLDIYVSGIFVLLFLYEILALITISNTQSSGDFINIMTKNINIILVASALLAVICVFVFWKKRFKKELTNAIKGFKIQKRDIVIIGVIVAYIVVSVFFIAANLQDDTINSIYAMVQDDTIAIHDPVSAEWLEEIDGHTKTIELFYMQLASATGVEVAIFVDYIMASMLLIFLFGVYKRIEHIFLRFNPKMASDKKWAEWAFLAMCIALFFIDGNISIAIPQNIWNGKTLLFSCIVPFCFIYGYAVIVNVRSRRAPGVVYWLLNMALLIPIAAMMSDNGIMLISIMIMITVFVMLLVIVTEIIRKNIMLKQESK